VADALSRIGYLLQKCGLRFSVLTSSKALTSLVYLDLSAGNRNHHVDFVIHDDFLFRGPSYAFLRRRSGTS